MGFLGPIIQIQDEGFRDDARRKYLSSKAVKHSD
jgi:hypothetical protein